MEDEMPAGRRQGGRIALVHEWITANAGSEQVFAALARVFPDGDLYALTARQDVDLGLGDRHVVTTLLDRTPLRERRDLSLPLMPLAWRALGRGGYDLVITSHHALAISNRLPAPGGLHLAYVHSPARYLWTPEIDARGAGRLRRVPRALLRSAERRAAARLTSIAANSAAVRDRIARFWDRPSTVIHPPVRVEFFGRAHAPQMHLPPEFLLSHGRWIPYKNHVLAIRAADRAGLPLVISGQGPDEARLRAEAAQARVPVIFLKRPTDEQVRELMAGALALLFPAEEDFGITPVEAQAAGTPVVALARGGSLETVADGVSGILVEDETPDAFAEAIAHAAVLSPMACKAHAQAFDFRSFARNVHAWVNAASPAA